jgi:hypothetical protein
MIKKRSFFNSLFAFTLVFPVLLVAQTTQSDGKRINTIKTAAPFLLITPDARSGAMGDAGVAISPDANSMHWNPSKLVFLNK